MDVDNFRRLFRYDHWANEKVSRSLKTATGTPSRSLDLLAHILGAEYVWYSRLQRSSSPIAIWPQLTVVECEHHVLTLKDIWQGYLRNLGTDGLGSAVSYTNTKGDVFTTGISDILMHIVMHSSYHRGQIAADMRANGSTPVYTDFIHAVRQNKLD